MSPRVLNIHKEIISLDSVYIGRPSLYGNPFAIDLSVGLDRDTVIELYGRYLDDHPEIVKMARKELKGKDLLCFCAPKACHGDILLKIANSD